MKKIRLLFQGDSITDCWRNYEDYHDLGRGYAKYAAEYLTEKYKDVDFEFIDLGISGNQTKDLLARMQSDIIDIQPDIVSILIGVNDTFHHIEDKSWISDELFESNYRTILEAIKQKTSAKIMIIDPFSFPVEDKLVMREDMSPKIDIIRKLAREYADIYMPLDGLFASVFVTDDPISYTEDGLHPSDKGAEFIGRHYAEYISQIIEKLICKA